jgi:hypothetical protein
LIGQSTSEDLYELAPALTNNEGSGIFGIHAKLDAPHEMPQGAKKGFVALWPACSVHPVRFEHSVARKTFTMTRRPLDKGLAIP